MGGMVRDLMKDRVPKDKYLEAENMKLADPTEDTIGGATVSIGNELAFDLGTFDFDTNADDYKAYRIKIDNTAPNIQHTFVFGGAPNVITSAIVGAGARYTDLVNKIVAAATADGLTTPSVYIPSPLSGTAAEIYVGFRAYGSDYTLSETIVAEAIETNVIKEFYGTACNGQFFPLKTWNNGNDLYVLSTNESVLRLGVGVKDEATGNWAYTIVLETKTIEIPQDVLIDLDGQIDFNSRVSLYATGKTVLPRAFYVTQQTTWTTGFSFIYNEDAAYMQEGNPDGFYTHDNVGSITQLQVIKNFATVTLKEVTTGGSLTSGNKIYLVRQWIGEENSSGFSLASNPVSIFNDLLTDTQLSGNEAGTPTGKRVVLTISNLDPDVYDNFEVVVVENNDGVFTAKSLGLNSITDDSMDFSHTGVESTTEVTPGEINTEQVVIKDAANLVVNRNRLFLSDIRLEQTPDFTEWAKTITVTTTRTTVPAIGTTFSTVNEYQKPANIFAKGGYMLNETERFALVLFLKTGYITQPTFIKDHTFTFATGELTSGGAATPTGIYIYYPQFSIDFSTAPDIDGVPLKDLVYGFSIVKAPSIPEILATGYIMLSDVTSSPYPVGKNIVSDTAYVIGNTDARRQRGAAIVPDILFDQVDVPFTAGDQLLVYGQPFKYNQVAETRVDGIHVDYNYIEEFAGDFNNTFQAVDLVATDLVDFNSTGVIPMNGLLYTTIIQSPSAGWNNQKSLAVSINPLQFFTKQTANTDRAFYYCQYYHPQTNKFGNENSGKYVSCGNFTNISIPDVYNVDVFGGDTFTQKNFTKLCNFSNYLVNDYRRVGISFYTQNRGNYQMRYFDDSDPNLNYPYQTTSLVRWLSGATTGASELSEGTLLYSRSYTPNNLFQTLQAFNPNARVQKREANIIRYSQLKIDGSPIDTYRIFLPLDFKAMPAIYGTITNTFRDDNALLVMMSNGILRQEIDQQEQETTESGISIIIGDGTVLGAREVVISNYGSPLKTGALQYLTTTGRLYTAWVNLAFKKVFRRGVDGIRDLTQQNYFQSFFNTNTQFLGAEKSISMGYDGYSNELLISANATVPGAVAYQVIDTYSAGDIVYGIPSATQFIFYRAKRDVPADTDPSDPANQLQYWEPYRNSNFTLSYNERIDQWSSFYTYNTKMFISYKNTFLTHYFDLNVTTQLWEHNRGEALNWYGALFPYAYLKTVFNNSPQVFKVARVLWAKSEARPFYMHAVGINGSKTFGVAADFKQNRDYWWANIKNDASFTVANPTGLNTTHTRGVESETIDITLFFDDANKIDELALKYFEKPRRFNL